MAAVQKRVQLFYDVLSPYSWVAFEVLCRYRSKWNMKLEFCPFFLSGIIQGAGNRPPGIVQAKASYMGKDISRINQYYKIPLKIPSDVPDVLFVKGSLRAQRLLTAAKSSCTQETVEQLSRQLWLRVWSRDEDITEADSLRDAGRKAGLSEDQIGKLIDQTSTVEVKEELKRTTQEALDLGAFGAPFIVAHVGGKKERFFGSDRMELLAHTMGEKWLGPLVEQRSKI